MLDAVLVPAGGGGLVSGIALALSGTSPRTRVVSVEPENYDGMRRSLAAGERSRAAGGTPSIADSLMALMPGEIPFAISKDRLSLGIVVTDEALNEAVAFAAQQLKLVVEPGGAAALAAVLSGAFLSAQSAICIVLTGGNCDIETVANACAAAREL